LVAMGGGKKEQQVLEAAISVDVGNPTHPNGREKILRERGSLSRGGEESRRRNKRTRIVILKGMASPL